MSSERPGAPRRPRRPMSERGSAPARTQGVADALPLEPASDGPAEVTVRTVVNHPFLFRKMVEVTPSSRVPARGEIVRVVDREGELLGHGLWNPRSTIAVRMLNRSQQAPDRDFWRRRLTEAVQIRTHFLGLDRKTNAYRLVHAEGDGLTGLVVDRLAEVLSVECFSLGIRQRIVPIIKILQDLTGAAHYRVRVDERVLMQEDFTAVELASAGLPAVVTIHEHGIRYRVRFEGAHKTGFFCDQRDNRERLAAYCADRVVLDVCSYTGGFGLNAKIRGQAREVTCVDLDERALALARENANLNQARLGLVHADAFGYLRQMSLNQRTYAVVVLDPPKLVTSRDELLPAKKKYFDMNALALRLVEPGGLLLTCSCSGMLPAHEFRSLVRAAARTVGRPVRVLEETGAAMDHPVALDVPETRYLKALWLLVGERETSDTKLPGIAE